MEAAAVLLLHLQLFADVCLRADAVHASLVAASANGLGGRDVGAMLLAVQQSAGLCQQGRE